jgi:hypothetical protein
MGLKRALLHGAHYLVIENDMLGIVLIYCKLNWTCMLCVSLQQTLIRMNHFFTGNFCSFCRPTFSSTIQSDETVGGSAESCTRLESLGEAYSNCLPTHFQKSSCQASQQIPSILWNPKVHYCVHKSLPFFAILVQMNLVHILPSWAL